VFLVTEYNPSKNVDKEAQIESKAVEIVFPEPASTEVFTSAVTSSRRPC